MLNTDPACIVQNRGYKYVIWEMKEKVEKKKKTYIPPLKPANKAAQKWHAGAVMRDLLAIFNEILNYSNLVSFYESWG